MKDRTSSAQRHSRYGEVPWFNQAPVAATRASVFYV